MKMVWAKVKLPQFAVDLVHRGWKKRREADETLELWKVWWPIFQKGLEFFDPETGLPRKPTSFGISFPSVSEEIEASILADDTALSLALDAKPLMTWVSGLDHGCLSVSRELAKYTGKAIDQLRGPAWLEALVHPADQARLMALTKDSYAAEQPSQIPYRIRRDDGVYAWIVDAARPRFHADGRLAGYVGTLYLIGPDRDRAPEERVIPIPDPETEKWTRRMQEYLDAHGIEWNPNGHQERREEGNYSILSLPTRVSKTDFAKGMVFQAAHHAVKLKLR